MDNSSLQEQIDHLERILYMEVDKRANQQALILEQTNKIADIYKALTLTTEKFAELFNLHREQITALTNQANTTVAEVDKQIAFQHWFLAEMEKPENEPPVPFEPSSKPTLKSVK